MLLMPMAASVPTTVAMHAAAKATPSETPRLFSTMSLWNRFWYHLKVKPVNTVRLLLSLKLNAMSTAMGTYKKPNTSTRYAFASRRPFFIPSPPFPRCRQW